MLFVGFQSQDTLGRQILDGQKQVRIHGQDYPVKAHIERLQGLSAHAGQSGLMRWLRHFDPPPERVFLTHGEPEPIDSLSRLVQSKLGWNVIAPEYGSSFSLDGG